LGHLREEAVGDGGAIGIADGTIDGKGHAAVDGVNVEFVFLAAVADDFEFHNNILVFPEKRTELPDQLSNNRSGTFYSKRAKRGQVEFA
jgi:hypothetical protein